MKKAKHPPPPMAARPKILLVDANNMAYRSAWRLREWPGLAFLGVIHEVFEFLSEDPHDYAVFCFDDRRPKFRLKLWPEYKSRRAEHRRASHESEKTYETYKASIAALPELLRRLGADCARCPGFEGDDVIAALALRRFGDCAITILSEDLDFIQLCDGERVGVYHPSKRKYERRCPDGWLYRKMLIGDASDNLPGLPGVGAVKADRLLDSLAPIGSFAEMTEHARIMANAGNRDAASLYASRDMLERQMKVINLRRVARAANRKTVITAGAFDARAFMDYAPLAEGMRKHPDAKSPRLLPWRRLFAGMARMEGFLEAEEIPSNVV